VSPRLFYVVAETIETTNDMPADRLCVAEQELQLLKQQFRRELFAFLFITIVVAGGILGIIVYGWGFSWLFFVVLGIIMLRACYDLSLIIGSYLHRRRFWL
jgi:hypothetical protein